MCQPNQKCPLCLIAEKQSKEKSGVFTCEKCSADFEKGIKMLKYII